MSNAISYHVAKIVPAIFAWSSGATIAIVAQEKKSDMRSRRGRGEIAQIREIRRRGTFGLFR